MVQKIASFTVDHDLLCEGIYVSRIDGDVTTYDLRTRVPNSGDYMDNITMHSVEHMLATYLRSGEMGRDVIYFGPMGCQTGFYLLVRNADNGRVLSNVKRALESTLSSNEMFGAVRRECGNYKNLDLQRAKEECSRYLNILNSRDHDFKYKGEKI